MQQRRPGPGQTEDHDGRRQALLEDLGVTAEPLVRAQPRDERIEQPRVPDVDAGRVELRLGASARVSRSSGSSIAGSSKSRRSRLAPGLLDQALRIQLVIGIHLRGLARLGSLSLSVPSAPKPWSSRPCLRRPRVKTAMRAYIDAFNSGSAEAVAALYAENATVEDPVGTPVRQGRSRHPRVLPRHDRDGCQARARVPCAARTATPPRGIHGDDRSGRPCA